MPEWDQQFCGGEEGWMLPPPYEPNPYSTDPEVTRMGCAGFATVNDGGPTIAGFCCRPGSKLP